MLLQMVSALDVRIHHRICDVQKHLLHSLVKLTKRLVCNFLIKLHDQQNFYIALDVYSIYVRPQQRVSEATNRLCTRCENSSQNL